MKRAWEMEYEVMQKAKPVILTEEEQTWTDAELLGDSADAELRMRWSSNVPGSGAPEKVMVGAIQSMYNMGYNVENLERLIPQALKALEDNDMQKLNIVSAHIWRELNNCPIDTSTTYHNFKVYDSLEKYKSSVKFPKYETVNIHSDLFSRQIYGAWLAQICGGALGTAIEGYTTKNLKETFGDIRYYVRTPNTYNDDITYELAFLQAFEEKGYEVTSSDIADRWIGLVPSGWSAEEVALRNIKYGIYPPQSGYFGNPYREWIGAQMRGAICGMVAPGDCAMAATLAFRDGEVSHHNNGVLGEVFNALIVSLAFVETDIHKILELSVGMIPSDSEYYSVVSFALQQCHKHQNWEEAWSVCEEKYKEYNWIHAYPNAAAEIIALWYGQGDFDETMHIISMEGQDVDCNAAQIASALGVLNPKIDARWSEPIGDMLITYLRGNKRIYIRDLSQKTVSAVINGAKGL